VMLQSAARREAACAERWRRQRTADELKAAVTIQRMQRGSSTRRFSAHIFKVLLSWQAKGKASTNSRRFQAILACRRQYAKLLQPHEIIILASVVTRETTSLGIGVSRRQVLIFSSLPRVLCVDLAAKGIEWQMKWTRHLAVEQLSRNEFTVSDNRSVHKFVDLLGDASRWKVVEHTRGLEDVSQYSTAVNSTLIASLSQSDAYLPSAMLRFQGALVKRSLLSRKPRWQKRWIVLQGHTVYWFAGSNVPKGQLEITLGSSVGPFEAEDVAGTILDERGGALTSAGSSASFLSPRGAVGSRVVGGHPASVHKHAFIVRTPELQRGGVPGLVLQAESAEERTEWMAVFHEAVPKSSTLTTLTAAEDDDRAAAPSAARPAILRTAAMQGWLGKRAVHSHGEHWRPRWMALSGGTIYWFTGYYQIKGSLALTRGTWVRDLGPRPHAFAVSTPEMERAGLYLGLQATDAAKKARWIEEILAAIDPGGTKDR